MIYCLNTDCPSLLNSDEATVCQSCGTRLIPLLRNRYRLTRPLGGGGFGRAFLAEDQDKMRELCVVKQFNPRVEGTKALHKASQMFEQEAKQLQQLGEHPQIPTLYAYFEQDKYLYIIQQFIAGQSLEQELKQNGTFSPHQIYEILAGILPVLSFIHARQVIHRDLKPANIIRRQPDGRLTLIDFGVAKTLSETAASQSSTTVGSMGYAPLEQMKHGQILPASDLFSLGVTCFHLLSGLDPEELWTEQGYSWLTHWQQYCPNLPAGSDLTPILSKLLRKDSQQRYQSAEQVLQDLQSIAPVAPGARSLSSHFLDNQSTGDIAQSTRSELRQQTSSEPVTLPNLPAVQTRIRETEGIFSNRLLLAGIALLVVGIGGYGYSQLTSRTSPDPTTISTGGIITPTNTLTGHTGEVNTVAITPDGRSLISAGDDKTIKIWDLQTGQAQQTLEGHTNWIYSLAISPDGRTLASGSKDNAAKVWDLAEGRELYTLTGHVNYINGVAFSPDNQILATASYDKTVKLWSVPTGEAIGTLRGHTGYVLAVAFSPDGQVLASGSYDKYIKLWDLKTQQELHTLRGHFSDVNVLAFSADGQRLVSASDDRTLRLWDWKTGKALQTISTDHAGPIFAMALSSNGQIVASGSEDETIKLWDLSKGKELQTLRGHSGAIFGLAFSPDGKILASASKDKTIKLWTIAQ
jgi:WD40 repeat protein